MRKLKFCVTAISANWRWIFDRKNKRILAKSGDQKAYSMNEIWANIFGRNSSAHFHVDEFQTGAKSRLFFCRDNYVRVWRNSKAKLCNGYENQTFCTLTPSSYRRGFLSLPLCFWFIFSSNESQSVTRQKTFELCEPFFSVQCQPHGNPGQRNTTFSCRSSICFVLARYWRCEYWSCCWKCKHWTCANRSRLVNSSSCSRILSHWISR